jgi:hypothetical protein
MTEGDWAIKEEPPLAPVQPLTVLLPEERPDPEPSGDVERARMAWLEHYGELLTGAKPSFAVGKRSRKRMQLLVELKYQVGRMETRFGRKMPGLREFINDMLSVELDSRKDLNEIAKRLATPNEKPSLGERLASAFSGGRL